MSVSVEQIITAIVIVVASVVVAQIVDWLLRRRRDLPPETLTRYRALRRTLSVLIVTIGLAMAAFVFPDIRGVAGALLTSAAVIGVVVGIAAQASLGNFISGLVLAFSQPIRIGDRIEFRGVVGTVDDVGRIYTRVRTTDGGWLEVPNNLLASDTIRNWTIVDPECTVSVRVPVPFPADLGWVMEMVLEEARAAPGALPGRAPSVTVQELGTTEAELAVRVWIPSHDAAESVSSVLLQRIHGRLRENGSAVSA
jgi:small-conductance mechanosensitive channel